MEGIDQTSIIEQLAAENVALREVLRHSPDREIQVIAAVSMVLDELTRIGPQTTARVLLWAFEKYGIRPASFVGAWKVRDRRPKETVSAPPTVEPEVPSESTKRQIRGETLRARRMACGLKQKELGRIAGIHQVRISQIEQGVWDAPEDVWTKLMQATEPAS